MNLFKSRVIRKANKRMKKDGTLVEKQYVLYINCLDPIYFPTREAVRKYLEEFRKNTEIFKLQIYRVETYSL